MKICINCKVEKEDSEFSFKNKAKGRLNSQCKVCQREYTKKHYQDNKKDYLERNTEHKEKMKLYLKDIKSNLKCSECDESHIACLDFHHLGDKSFEIAKATNYSIAKLEEEIKKCIVLCSNCHRKHHYNESLA